VPRIPHRLPQRQTGFTLLEVLVAFVLAAIGIVALIQAFAGGLRNLGKMDEFVMAAMVAESRLAEVGILYPVAGGEMEGVEEGDKYHWRISVVPFEDPDGLTLMPEQTPNLYLVEVDVSWDSGRNPGSFRLESLRVGP
jgi:general secretion pathway protein I